MIERGKGGWFVWFRRERGVLCGGRLRKERDDREATLEREMLRGDGASG